MKNDKYLTTLVVAAGFWVSSIIFLTSSISLTRATKRKAFNDSRLIARLAPAMSSLRDATLFKADIENAALDGETVSPEAWLATLGENMTPYSTHYRTVSEHGSFKRIAADVVWTKIAPRDFAFAVASGESFFPQIRLSAVSIDNVTGDNAKIAATFEAIIPETETLPQQD